MLLLYYKYYKIRVVFRRILHTLCVLCGLKITKEMKYKKDFSLHVGEHTITAIFSDLADQAHGSVMLKCNETVLLATAVMSKQVSGTSWFNLTVDYMERFYAAGQILGGKFKKREGKPSDDAILASRVIDRTLRPLFDQRNPYAVQVIVTVLAVDGTVDPVTLAVNAASLALHTSSIPWNGPVGSVRFGEYQGKEEFFAGSEKRIKDSMYDLIVCGKQGKINMIEADAFEVSEEILDSAFKKSQEAITLLEEWQEKIRKEIGSPKEDLQFPDIHPALTNLFQKDFLPRFPEYITSGKPGKETINILHHEWSEKVSELLNSGDLSDEEKSLIKIQSERFYDEKMDDFVHLAAIEKNTRADGRAMDEVRELFGEAGGISKVLHGSGTFYRGGTHVVTVLTLGGPGDAESVEGMEFGEDKHFMHHYNFPPFSAGETGRAGFTNRREIGHGALAEKAVSKILPNREDFPYTIRLVSESTASNGSTSQASICASSLALMDGGVPVKSHVAGIAMGLMYQDEFNYKILTDIQGPEDHYGDMDFKVAGTNKGITAIQLDVKVDGVSRKILVEALHQAGKARLHILNTLSQVISEPRKDISPFAPKIDSIAINPDKIGAVIGSGGKVVNEIREKTGTEIQIEDSGMIFITGKADGPAKARKMIEEIVREYAVGDMIEGQIVKIADFGVFISLGGGKEGMIHISEIAPFRIEKIDEYLAVGQTVPAKVIKIEKGKIGLSIKEANKEFVKPKK